MVGGVVGTACACCPTGAAQASGDWNYTYPGPAAWEGTCADGLNQSPIDIPISRLQPIRFKYPDTVKANVINNGHGSPQVHRRSPELPELAQQGVPGQEAKNWVFRKQSASGTCGLVLPWDAERRQRVKDI